MTDVREARKFLEANQVQQLLEQYVLDCAKDKPADVLAHLGLWAAKRRNLDRGNSMPSSSSAQNQGTLPDNKSKPMFTAMVLGTKGAREEVVDAAEEWVAEVGFSSVFNAFSKKVRGEFHEVDASATVIPIETAAFGAVLIAADADVSVKAMQFLSTVDVVLLCAATNDGVDLKKKRDGQIYNMAVMAHSAGVRSVAGVFGGEGSDAKAVLTELQSCVRTSGFDEKFCCFGRVTSDEEVLAVLQGIRVAPRITLPASHQVSGLSLTVMVLAEEVSAKQILSCFCGGLSSCSVVSIKNRIDKSNGKILEKNPKRLKSGEVGTIAVSCSGSFKVAKGTPFTALIGKRVMLVGSVTSIDDGADDESLSFSESSSSFEIEGGSDFVIDE